MCRSWYNTFTSNKNFVLPSTFYGVFAFWVNQCLDHDIAHLNQLKNVFPHMSLMELFVHIKWQLCFVIWFWMNQCLGPDITHPNWMKKYLDHLDLLNWSFNWPLKLVNGESLFLGSLIFSSFMHIHFFSCFNTDNSLSTKYILCKEAKVCGIFPTLIFDRTIIQI